MSKNDLVVKSNRLIEASYRLTLAEQRIILFAITEARRTQKGLNADDFADIQAADYAATFHVPMKQAYEQIKEAALALYERGFVLYDTDPATGKPRTIKGRWVSAASYIDGAGTIQLRFAPDIVPFINHLEAEFTRYKLEKVADMSSAYAIRLYELLMQWGSAGRRDVELEWLKKTLMLDKTYERLDNLKKRVIDVALSQINEHSDLTARYTQRKTGRTVTHLIFTFAPKETAPAVAVASEPKNADGIRESELFKSLRRHGIGVRLALAWLRQDEGRVRAALEYVEARAQQGRIKGSTAGYLRALFEGGAELGPSAFEIE
jgi:plasmid replication initiation protein